jgi:hypothetical protein
LSLVNAISAPRPRDLASIHAVNKHGVILIAYTRMKINSPLNAFRLVRWSL